MAYYFVTRLDDSPEDEYYVCKSTWIVPQFCRYKVPEGASAATVATFEKIAFFKGKDAREKAHEELLTHIAGEL